MEFELVKLNKEHRDCVSNLLADAFMDNPLMVYFFPKQSERTKRLPEIYKVVVDIMMVVGTVYTTSYNIEGVIGVIDNKKIKHRTIIKILGVLLKNIMILRYIFTNDIIKKFGSIPKSKEYKDKEKIFYIEMVAVDKKYRGKKYMSKLIRAVTKEAKCKNYDCVLETETLENVAKYKNLGFELYDKVEVKQGKVSKYKMVYKY